MIDSTHKNPHQFNTTKRVLLRRYGPAILLAFLTVMVSVLGFYQIFTNFAEYDDEGYVLYSLRNFLLGHALYNEVFTQYGPGYFLIHMLLIQGLNLPLTHDTIRLLSLFFWVFGSLAVSLGVYHFTHNTMLAVIALLISFIIASAITNEPGHPQAMIYGLVGLTVLLTTYLPQRWAVVLLGVFSGLTFVTKANIGVFLFGAFAWVFLCRSGSGLLVVTLRVLCGLGLLLMPLALMHQRFSDHVIVVYALVSTGANLNLLLSCPVRLTMPGGIGAFWLFSTSFGATCALGGIFALIRGTTLAGLYQGIIGEHLQFAEVFWLDPPMHQKVLIAVLLAVIVCLLYARWQHTKHQQRHQKLLRLSLALIKLLFAVITIYLAKDFRLYDKAGYLIPWMWLLMVPPKRALSSRQLLRRYALLAVATLQFLYAYPVAGSQMAFALVLTIPISCILLADVVTYLQTTRWLRVHERPFASYLVYIIAFAIILNVMHRVPFALSVYEQNGAPLVLKGASRLRLSEPKLATYEALTLNIQNSADRLLTMPGMYSFCLWSGVDSPTLQNLTDWTTAFNATKQQSIVQEASHVPRLVAIRNSGLVQFWNKAKELPSGPLVQYVDQQFVQVASVGGYDLLVRKLELDKFRLFGAWWLSAAQVKLPALNSHLTYKKPVQLALISLPPMDGQLHQLDVYNPYTQTHIQLGQFSDGTDLALLEPSGSITKLKASSLKNSGLSMAQPRQIVLPLDFQQQPRSDDFYIVHVFGPSRNLLLRLPFMTVHTQVKDEN